MLVNTAHQTSEAHLHTLCQSWQATVRRPDRAQLIGHEHARLEPAKSTWNHHHPDPPFTYSLRVHALPPEWRVYLIVVTCSYLDAWHPLLKPASPGPECWSVMLLELPADGPGCHMTHLMTQGGAQARLGVKNLQGQVTDAAVMAKLPCSKAYCHVRDMGYPVQHDDMSGHSRCIVISLLWSICSKVQFDAWERNTTLQITDSWCDQDQDQLGSCSSDCRPYPAIPY